MLEMVGNENNVLHNTGITKIPAAVRNEVNKGYIYFNTGNL